MTSILRAGGLAAVLASIAMNGFAAGVANTASLFLRAEPGNYIGYDLSAPDGQSFVQGTDLTFRSAVMGPWETEFYSDSKASFSLTFTAPKYSSLDNTVMARPLQAGFYDNARRVMSAPELSPGMDVSGFAHGYNRLSGWFNVIEVAYSPTGEINLLAVDFAEYGENLTKSGPALYGSFRFNSSIPLTTSVPEPGTATLYLLAGLGWLTRLPRQRKQPLGQPS